MLTPVTPTVDLSSTLGAARDQGMRPTCLAFAASDAHRSARQGAEDFSAEYAFYHAVAHARLPSFAGGTTLDAMCKALQHEGQPHEVHYPYAPLLPRSAPLPKPPAPFPHPTYCERFLTSAGSAAEIGELLLKNCPSIAVLNISAAFHYLAGPYFKIVPIANDRDIGSHAVVAIGLGSDSNGRSYIRIRNSWGKSWGDRGHAWVRDDYIDHRLSAIAIARSI